MDGFGINCTDSAKEEKGLRGGCNNAHSGHGRDYGSATIRLYAELGQQAMDICEMTNVPGRIEWMATLKTHSTIALMLRM